MKSAKNISESVRQRILNQSKSDKRPFMELLQYYAMERFLYRLTQSSHAQSYVLKGALMLRAWKSPEFRPTMDIDMLGKTGNDEENIVAQIRDILAVETTPDGLTFDAESVRTERITEDAVYEGINVRFLGFLGTARITMQIDIGFGDIVYPEPQKEELPCVLDFPTTSLYCYSRESAVAEKFDAMIKHGSLNSRMKDFYDIWLLSRQFDFNLSDLSEAIRLTFKQRGTELKQPLIAFSSEFISSRQSIWSSFHKRLKQDHVPDSFADVVSEVELFLTPVINNSADHMSWPPAGPWT
jgi:predicted nucleotidyltransferase component of viral defense system